jgi:hypothetical protein
VDGGGVNDGTLKCISGELVLDRIREGLIDAIRGLEEGAGLEEGTGALGLDESCFEEGNALVVSFGLGRLKGGLAHVVEDRGSAPACKRSETA